MASVFSQYVFVALVALVAAAFVRGTRVAGGSALRSDLLLILWLGLAGALAWFGVLRHFEKQPPPILPMVIGYFIASTALVFSPLGARLSQNVDVSLLVGVQFFRFPLELLLHRLYLEGELPVQMTYAGRNFDIVTGLLAGAIFLWSQIGAPPRWVYWAFNGIGLALLVNIVSIAVLSMPTPLRQFMNEPANRIVADFPFVWLPTFLVQAAWAGHWLLFRKLWREQPQ